MNLTLSLNVNLTIQGLEPFLKEFLMDQAQQTAALQAIADGLGTVSATIVKASGEITTEIALLKDQVAAGGASTPAMDALFSSIQDKVTALAGQAKTLDDLNPDAPAAG